MVYLKIRPYRQHSLENCQNENLAPRFYRPFEVLKKIEVVACKLKLPPRETIHPVFHVSLLRKVVGATQLPQPFTLSIVLKIHSAQVKGVVDQEVLIKWKGLLEFEASWELFFVIQQQSPHFHLEGKVQQLVGGNDKPPIHYTYIRRGKRLEQGG